MKTYLKILLFFVFALVVSLRLFQVSSVPIAPYWEEVAVAYDSYSILKTGSDHHGNWMPIVALESFGDWKPTGYAYAQIPFILLFGLTTLAIRLPAALAGISLAVFVGYYTWKISGKPAAGVLGLLVAAVSPWQIMFSRAGWEVTLATALLSWGSTIFYISLRQKKDLIYLQILGLVMLWSSAYTYHAMRVLVPMLIGAILLHRAITMLTQQNTKVHLLQLLRLCIPSMILSLVFLLPFVSLWGKPQLQQRFAETSIFSDTAITIQRNEAVEIDENALSTRISNHRVVLFALRIAAQYASHFSPDFLFFSGDSNIRHASGYGGMLYVLDSVTLLIGAYYVLQNRKQMRVQTWAVIPLLLLVISPIPASVTTATPHALRALPMSSALLVVSGVGLYKIFEYLVSLPYLKTRYQRAQSVVITLLIFSLYCIQPLAWLRHYFSVYSVTSQSEWQYGYAELIPALKEAQQLFPDRPVFVSRAVGRPAMYVWYYTLENPLEVQGQNQSALKDQGEFLTYNKYVFFRSVSEIDRPNSIAAVVPTESLELRSKFSQVKLITTINDPTGKAIWEVLFIQN